MITKFKYYSVISFVNYVPCPEAKESVIGAEVELSFQCRIGRDEATIRGIYYNNYAITWLPFTTMYTYCKWEILFEHPLVFIIFMCKYLPGGRCCLRYQISDLCHIS